MTTFKVISVNPSEKTKGELCSGQIYRKMIRGKKISYEKQDAGEWLLNFLFPTRKSGFRLSVLLLSIRLIFATLLIYNGVEIISGAYSIAVMPDSVSGYMILAAGILLIAGFLTRITSFIISVFLIFLGIARSARYPDVFPVADAMHCRARLDKRRCPDTACRGQLDLKKEKKIQKIVCGGTGLEIIAEIPNFVRI